MNFIRYLFKAIISFITTFLLITAFLYSIVMFTPAETRATLYMPKSMSPRMTEEMYNKMIQHNIEKYHLDGSFLYQYSFWLSNLIRGNWGYSPTLKADVLSSITQRLPITVELMLYSLILFVPSGLVSGVLAAKYKNKAFDNIFRFCAFIATSLPPFIFAILLMVIFYIGLHWFVPGHTSLSTSQFINSDEFLKVTGMLTIDGLINGRFDVTVDSLRHLTMPAMTLALTQWAILGRITRITMVEEMGQDYVIAARSRGLREGVIVWRHMMGNILQPIITNSMLSIASILTSIFIVEILFNIQGISSLAVKGMGRIPDAPLALGFTIYSVMTILLLMGLLDFIQIFLDPRTREKK